MARLSFTVSCLLLLVITAAAEPTLDCSTSLTHHHLESQHYRLRLSVDEYNPSAAVTITVRVGLNLNATGCPTIDTPGPYWYNIQALSGNKELVGKFEEPKLRTESVTANSGKMVEFCTSEPFVTSDLPMDYEWSKPAGDSGQVCFWLTLLESMDTSTGSPCRRVKQCISPTTDTEEVLTGSGEDLAPIEIIDDDETQVVKETKNKEFNITAARLKCENDCSQSKQGEFCTIPKIPNGSTFSSRCEWQVRKCILKKQGINVTKIDLAPCSKVEALTKPSECWEMRDHFDVRCEGKTAQDSGCAKRPRCTNSGDYKRVQCSRADNRCWCVDPYDNAYPGGQADIESTCNNTEFEGFKNSCS